MTEDARDSEQIFMEELKQEFMESVSRNMTELKRLYSDNNMEEIRKIAHDIKGTSGIFGLDEGTEIARQLHQAAKSGETAKTGELISKLISYMRSNDIIS